MHSVLVSLVTLLAAASIAAPVSTLPRRGGLPGVGSVASPLTAILGQVGKQTPDALNKATGSMGGDQKTTTTPMTAPKNGTAKATPASKPPPSDPLTGLLGGLTGGLGGGLL
ncbi:hypothetical protein F4775DRAFT_3699 [Biscogniauxia sp. FL1348]|nr:hypothetical protein F4775DRAFT_3699 [Biscogniauxia sp. FL1348]